MKAGGWEWSGGFTSSLSALKALEVQTSSHLCSDTCVLHSFRYRLENTSGALVLADRGKTCSNGWKLDPESRSTFLSKECCFLTTSVPAQELYCRAAVLWDGHASISRAHMATSCPLHWQWLLAESLVPGGHKLLCSLADIATESLWPAYSRSDKVTITTFSALKIP